MGLADRDYMRKRKVQWDESRGEMRLSDDEPSRPSGSSSWFGWLAVLVAIVVAGLWWYRAGGPPLPTVEVPAATVQDAPGDPVAMVESDNPVLVGRVTRVLDGDTIVVQAKGVTTPAQARFGWRNVANPNLINQAGLPASPFKTENWQGGTGE